MNRDDCRGVTCDRGGTCVDAEGSYSCTCMPGFGGQHCQGNYPTQEVLPINVHARAVLLIETFESCNVNPFLFDRVV